MTMAPWEERAEAREIAHQGAIHWAVPGRTDRINVGVLPGSYVLPADIVSGLGEGNTLAGSAIIKKMFSGTEGPYGSAVARASGGRANNEKLIKIRAAGGEYVLTPDEVASIGDGDVDLGHKVLDAFVKSHRASTIKTLKKLPPPAKN